MKADAQRQKAAALLGEEYKPAVPGVGAAWCASNSDFLCLKTGLLLWMQECMHLDTSTKLAWGTRHQAPCKICRSHNFLNQKPWHPLNFRNQMKVFEAQEQAEKDAKAKAQGKVRRGKHMHLGASKAYWQSAPRIKSAFLMLT